MKAIDVTEHFTKLDRSVFDEQDEYAKYFEFLQKAFSNLIHSFTEQTTDSPIEVKVMHLFIQKFLNTIEALRTKYLLENEHFLRVDLTESSFPNHVELKKFSADIEASTAHLIKLPSREALVRSTLDYLFDKLEKPHALLKQISLRTYFENLKQERLFTEFTPGKLMELDKIEQNDNPHLLMPWGAYDAVTNRPFLYTLIFEVEGAKPPFIDKRKFNKEAFIDQLRKITQNTSPLNVMAYEIDSLGEAIKPKVLKRTDLGPIYSKYSMDDNPFSKIIQQNFHNDFIFLFTTEIVFSIGEKRTKGFLSNGQLRQVFFIDETNKDCIERHVSKVLKYMMAPHHVVQHLHSNYPKLLTDFSIKPIAVV